MRSRYTIMGLALAGLILAGCARATPQVTVQWTTATAENMPPTGYPMPGVTQALPTGYPGSEQPTPAEAVGPDHEVLVDPPPLTGQVVYHAGPDNAHNIFVIDLATGEQTQLTDSGDNIEPSWSPDGQQIVYGCKSDRYLGLCVMNADGSNQHPIFSGEFDAWGPRWSPDGSHIAFVSSQEPYAHVYVLDLVSGQANRLVTSDGNEGGPRWSPDGARLIYMSDRNRAFNLYTIRADGTDEQQVTTFGLDDRPAFSPDGQFITFRREVVSASTFSGNEILVADANGQNERQLTNNLLADDWPSFSPDGKWILYSTLYGSTPQLQIVSVDGGPIAPLLAGGLPGNAPDWKP